MIQFPPIETHLVKSENVAQTFRIQVMRPGRAADDARRYPVVYATDGNWTFDMFKSIAYLIQMSELDSPPFILVGIGYPGDGPHAGYRLRMRDLVAPPFPQYEGWSDDWQSCVKNPEMEGVLEPEKGTPDFHGAESFRDFIEEELIPFVDERYETAVGENTYFGHSGGGFFGLYTLFSRPELFKNYVLSSPALSCHGESQWGVRYDNYDFGAQMLADFVASGPSLSGVKLFLSAGIDEEFEPAMRVHRITSSLLRFIPLVQDAKIPGLEVMFEIWPGESHKSIWPVAFTHGVQAVLGTRRVQQSLYFDRADSLR